MNTSASWISFLLQLNWSLELVSVDPLGKELEVLFSLNEVA